MSLTNIAANSPIIGDSSPRLDGGKTQSSKIEISQTGDFDASAKPERSSDRFLTQSKSTDFEAELLYSPDDQNPEILTCRIADMHLGGCALRYQGVALPTRPAQLHFHACRLGIDIKIVGLVRWSRQTGLGSFTSGFQFRQPLPPIIIEKLLEENQITRRVHHRKDVDQPVLIRQSNPTLVLRDARVVSVSCGGVQLITQQPLSLDSRLLLKLHNGSSAVANTVWSVKHGNEFRAGAAFMWEDQGRTFFSACD